MAYMQSSYKVHKVMIQPINVIFRHLQNRTRVSVWLNEHQFKIEGVIVGFDEFMNIIMDNAQEVHFNKETKTSQRREIGRILLKGDSVTMIQAAMESALVP